jgi:MFS family permease
MALMGAGVGIAGPSRDLLVRKAATKGLGEASYGRVYGFVYSGLDIGLATAPLIFGPIMDGGNVSRLWIGVAIFQGLAVLSALRVGRGAGA